MFYKNNNGYKELNIITLSRLFLEEAQQEVNADAPDPNQQSQDQQSQQGRKLSDEQIQQIVQGLQSGQISEQDIQQAVQQGQISQEDLQIIQQMLQQGGAQDSDNPENLEQMFSQEIDQLTDNFIRLNLYDKINDLIEKLDVFMETYNSTDDGLIDKLKQIKNYLNILGSLIFNLDVNLIYQLYITLEMKAIDILREGMGKGPDKELENIFSALEDQLKINEKRAELNPTEIINKLQTGEIQLQDLEQLIKDKIYSQGEIEKIIQIAQNGGNETIDDDQIDQVAQGIQSGEISPDEIAQAVDQGQLSMKDVEKIGQEVQNDEQLQSLIQQILGQTPENGQLTDEQIQQIIQGLQSGEIQPEEIEQAVQQGQISQEDFQRIQQAIENAENNQIQSQPQDVSAEQPQDQQMQDQNQDQQNPKISNDIDLLDIAKAILSGEMSADDLIQALYNNQISKENFQKIIKIIEDLKSDNNNQGDN